MYRLTQKDDQGNWCLKGLPWEQLYVGQVITQEVSEKLYGALWKLMEYEDTGLEPGEVQYLKDKSEPRMVRWTPAYQSYYSAGDEAECFCPVCDSDVVEDDNYFCPTCGQALKYHDEPEN